MNLPRLLLALVAGSSVFSTTLRADEPPFSPPKQYSADEVITLKSGNTHTLHVAMDDGKARSEIAEQGMTMVSIIRPDQKKMYSVMPAQKMVMVMPINDMMAAQNKVTRGDDAKFENAGADTVDGVACTKYKMTTTDGKVFYWWIDAAKKVPVKMAADDGSMSLAFKNYVIGPQEASLFEPPTDYQVMQMPAAPGAPGGGGAPGQ